MKDIEMSISTCKRRDQNVYHYEKVMWSAFCDRISRTKRTAETMADYKAMPKAEQDTIKDVGGYLLGDLMDGKRGRNTVVSRSAICLDLDFAPDNFWESFIFEFEWAAACYSTHKHKPSTPKYRVVIPLTREVSPEEYEAIARKIASYFMDIDWTDDTTFQPSRMMFWPSTSADGDYEFHKLDAHILDPDAILELYDGRWNDISRWPYSSRVEAKRETVSWTKQQDPTAKGGPVGTFCKTYTIQEAIEAFIPDVYTPTDKEDRWTYTAGSTAGGLVIYDAGTLAYSNHATDPAGDMHCVNAFDIVRIHKFGSLDEGSTKFGVNLPSYQAMVDLVSEDPECQKTMAQEMFKNQVNQLEEDETGISAAEYEEANLKWQTELTRNAKTGKLDETIENAVTILTNDTKLQGIGGYNEFQDFAEKCASLPWWKLNPLAPEWTDADTTSLFLYMEKFYGMTSERVIKHARNIVHTRRAFHPVRDYLDSLKWDQQPRLERLLVEYMGAEDNIYTREVTKKTLVGAVARIYTPGCKMDYTLTLTGPQGSYKSSLIRTLAGADWYNDSLDTFQGKEAYEALLGSWIVEIAELTAAKKSDVERTKQFITKQEDRFRKAYAEKAGRYRRQCIFIATTNSDNFLRDMTGNRRWWVVPVRKNEPTKNVFKELPLARDQIWAEAKHYFEQGEELVLSKEVEAMAAEMQEEYTYHSVKFDLVSQYLETELPANWNDMELVTRQSWLENPDTPGVRKRDKVCLLEIWQEVFGGTRNNFSNVDQREIADMLLKLGWIRSKGKRNIDKMYGQQRAFLRPVITPSDDYE